MIRKIKQSSLKFVSFCPEHREEEPSSSTPVKTGWRSTSPPPPVPLNDDNDGSSTSDDSKLSTSTEDLDISSSDPPVKSSNEIKQEKILVVQAKSLFTPPPSIFAGYQRKKSQSVKLTRIDPMEPCPKKAVRFADDFGLDLSQVKMIKSDELPHVPSEAFKDLRISSEESSTDSSVSREKTKEIHYLEQTFENPIHVHGFDDRVLRHKIVLEQASKSLNLKRKERKRIVFIYVLDAIDNRIYGTIKLVSLGMNKRVKIRLTTDNWNTHIEHEAIYICNSYDGTFDRFSFTLDVDRTQIYPGNVVQFCLCYELTGGPEHWDSNYQQNYRFNCVSRTIPDYSS